MEKPDIRLTKRRMYASHKSGAEKSAEETFSRRIYLNIFFNQSRQTADKEDFDADLFELKKLIESGVPVEELSASAQSKAKKYLQSKREAAR